MPGMPRLSIDELCRKYHNEEIHTRHVTQLALQLFDTMRTRCRFTLSDRRILEAAGRLHDIAYSLDPRRHREKGAALILRDGIRGYRSNESALIAATMLLHAGDIAKNRENPIVANSPYPIRAARLGAFLRIADGLDLGHMQDTTIVSLKCNRRHVRVLVRTPLFPLNLVRARQKSDLWQAELPVGIQLVQAKPLRRPVRLLGPDVNTFEAARRLIQRQFKAVTTNVDGAVRGDDIEPLHIVRVAVRRLRVALQAFRKPLAGTLAQPIYRTLGDLNRILGPARDFDVWIEFLTGDELAAQLRTNRRYKAFVKFQIESRRLQQPTVRRHLSGTAFNALRFKIGRLARTELPALQSAGNAPALEKLARRNLRRSLRRVFKMAGLRHSEVAEDRHELRQALRRARYHGEFFTPVLGAPFEQLTRRIHALEQELATIHDADVGLARMRSEGPPAPRLLVQMLEKGRQEACAQLDIRWRRLEKLADETSRRHKLKR